MSKSLDPIITVKLQKGLADRHRLPVSHVLRVLDEFRSMITEAGREIQRARGVAEPTDFGLEIVAGSGGTAFRRGSLEAHIAITTSVPDGLLAAQQVLSTVQSLNREDLPAQPGDRAQSKILTRLQRLARVQKTTKTEMKISVKTPGQKSRSQSCTYGSKAIAYAARVTSPSFESDGVGVYGKLTELTDKEGHLYDNDRGAFFGEILADDGQVWTAKFKVPKVDASKVARLFRRQVFAVGRAKYYRVQNPRLTVDSIDLAPTLEYASAFDDLFGVDRTTLTGDLDSLLAEARGG